jgi:hypothetical protein
MAPSLHTNSLFEVNSTLPQDSSGFQGNGNACSVLYHTRRIAGGRTLRGHPRAISVASSRACQLANALHLLPHWAVAVDAVGVKLDAHRTRVEIVEINLNLKHVTR